jgi:hypothetical protein
MAAACVVGVVKNEAFAVEHLKFEAHKILAPARDDRIRFDALVENLVEGVQIDHADSPSVDRNLHAATVIEIVKDAFRSGEFRKRWPDERAVRESALRAWR